jgi:hypothetical protein
MEAVDSLASEVLRQWGEPAALLNPDFDRLQNLIF